VDFGSHTSDVVASAVSAVNLLAPGWSGGRPSPGSVGGPMAQRLGICSAPSCDRVFVDTSRNGTKRFCTTACQNRVKAAAFRARQRQ
jgi:predicted RNA-binding Zn ribbon-like protein